MSVPLVTIGIINYNCKKYLETCLTSYFNQSYENTEIIVVDDCSTDGSVEVIKFLEQNHQNMRCIYHPQNSGGPSRGIQEIIKEARGKYFQWIASDDYAEIHAIRKFVDYLEKTNNDYVYCNLNIVDENNRITAHWNYTVPTPDEMIYRIFTYCSGVIPMNGLYRTRFFHENNITWSIYKDNDYSSDTINSLYFIKNGLKYGMIKESLINYRLHPGNCSHKIKERIITSFTVYDYIIKNFDELVYLPHIQWSNQKNREQFKNYVLAAFFYNRILRYIKLEDIPHYIKYSITGEKIKECIQVFVQEGMRYLQEGLTQGDALKNELELLAEKYESIFSE